MVIPGSVVQQSSGTKMGDVGQSRLDVGIFGLGIR